MVTVCDVVYVPAVSEKVGAGSSGATVYNIELAELLL
jgi:hypothetical protein